MKKYLSVLFAFALTGCVDQSFESPKAQNQSVLPAPPPQHEMVLAKVNEEVITQTEIDDLLKLELFELEWAKYEARLAALKEHIQQRTAKQTSTAARIEILIEPPVPPRLTGFDLPEQPKMGSENAPIEVAIFCNYQSSHCARMQEAYQQLATHYESSLRFVYYDYPLRFHRQAAGASQAARCAHRFGQFQGFHKALWVNPDQLNEASYLRIAKQLGMEETAFKTCLSDSGFAQSIEDNKSLAQQLGFSNVPVTLINGLYLNGPKGENILRYYIDQEIDRLSLTRAVAGKTDSSSAPVEDTQLPLRLEGLIGSIEQPAQASALIYLLAEKETRRLGLNEEVLAGVTLHQIYADYVLLNNQGRIERLRLVAGQRVASDEMIAPGAIISEEALSEELEERLDNIEKAVLASGNVLDSDELPPEDIGYQYRGVVAPKGELPLSKAWLQDQLVAQSELERHFRPGAMEVEGVHLLKLSEAGESEFYQTLGMQDGDVIMRVNGEWVHEAQNPLFQALAEAPEVSVVLMRKGLPVHHHYAIQ